ncbi:hypothetical protein KQX54_012667 [Cotesia glomerata]|uniref:Uncharacterized protein n=1 Tax=Cotesia glomerata TaxID=32391 RepID=A0AAV7I4H8_COTGL|nr:hypothetical protein KQX54_012667 [Cotesia glomerata]
MMNQKMKYPMKIDCTDASELDKMESESEYDSDDDDEEQDSDTNDDGDDNNNGQVLNDRYILGEDENTKWFLNTLAQNKKIVKHNIVLEAPGDLMTPTLKNNAKYLITQLPLGNFRTSLFCTAIENYAVDESTTVDETLESFRGRCKQAIHS